MFVAFEGGEGSGKSTQAAMLAARLRAMGLDVLATREPGGTALGAVLRRILLDGPGADPRAEALLFAADRAQHVAETILPALAAGAAVLCDRYIDSSIAYQGAAHPGQDAEIRRLSLWASRGLAPDLTVLLDVGPREGLARARGRSAADAVESRPLAYHARVAASFRRLAAEGGGGRPGSYLVLDAARPAAALHRDIAAAAGRLLARPGGGASPDGAGLGPGRAGRMPAPAAGHGAGRAS